MLQPTSGTRLLTPWFRDIRKAALITCTAAVLSLVIPVWHGTRTILATNPPGKWNIPLMVFVSFLTAIMPVFYFALYRNEGPLGFPKHLRLLSLAAALTLSVIVAAELPAWIGSLGPYWTAMRALDWTRGAISIVAAAQHPWTISHVSTLLGEFSNLACILLLIAFSRQITDESLPEIPVSRLLGLVAKVTVIAWGLWLAFNLIRVVLTPYTYVQARNYALQIGRTPPQLADLMAEPIRMLLQQACLFTAPYVVYKSRRDGTKI